MGIEIERKFLVADASWREEAEPGIAFEQGYLALREGMAVRVRIEGDSANINIKAVKDDLIHRDEFEYAIPLDDARALLANHCVGHPIAKTRSIVIHEGSRWEVDVFHKDNAPLVTAEIELDHADAAFEAPPWLGADVSHDPRYLNSHLSQVPYSQWNTQGE